MKPSVDLCRVALCKTCRGWYAVQCIEPHMARKGWDSSFPPTDTVTMPVEEFNTRQPWACNKICAGYFARKTKKRGAA
jgi:hypothetical protein